jgi:type III pantothenate kinase
MKLLLDLGNTRLKWALLDGGKLGPAQALAYADADFAPAFRAVLARLPPGTNACLASVAGADITEVIARLLQQRFGRVQRIGPPRSSAALTLAYAEPQTLGVDRWLALLAVGRRDALLVSCGSALTLDLLDADGHHHGGLIAPAPERMREALLARAPHLAGGGRVVEFADCTRDAVESGAVLAAVALIERQHASAVERLGRALPVLLSGGGAAVLRPWLRVAVEWREGLVLEGMAVWLRELAGDGVE